MSNQHDLEDNFAHALQAFLAGKLRPSGASCPHPGLLSARNDGKLRGEEASEVDAHLERCQPCRDRREALGSFRYQPEEFEHVLAVPLARELIAHAPAASLAESPPSRRVPRLRPAIGIAYVVVATAFIALRLPSALSVLLPGNGRALVNSALRMEPAPLAEEPPPMSLKDAGQKARIAAPVARQSAERNTGEAAPVVGGRATPPAADVPPAIVVIARSNDEVRWRIEVGQIFRSDDHGTSWRPQQGATTSRLLAASAPSGNVCWAAGKGGVVVRTTNGRTWDAVTPPTADDIVQVFARSAADATVRSADGERFSTVDGGSTWSRP